MKITKQRLKEIIKEELSSINETDLPAWEGDPFDEYDLEAENAEGRHAAAEELGLDPKDPSLWEKILDAVRRANLFPRAEQ